MQRKPYVCEACPRPETVVCEACPRPDTLADKARRAENLAVSSGTEKGFAGAPLASPLKGLGHRAHTCGERHGGAEQTAHRQRTDSAQTTHRQRTDSAQRLSCVFRKRKRRFKSDQPSFFCAKIATHPLCVVCALSVRCLCAVCALSVRCLLHPAMAPHACMSAMQRKHRSTDGARLANLRFAPPVLVLLRPAMTLPACMRFMPCTLNTVSNPAPHRIPKGKFYVAVLLTQQNRNKNCPITTRKRTKRTFSCLRVKVS